MLPLLAIGAVSAGAQLWSGFGAAGAKKAQVREQTRRMDLERQKTVSEATALGVASGITSDSASLQTYLASMNEEFKRQIDTFRRSGFQDAEAMRTSAVLGAGTTLASSLFSYGAATKWGQAPALTQPQPSYTPGLGMPLWRP